MAVIPVPSNRSSDMLLRSRLMNQLQQHQLDLLRVQDRLATGLRLAQPSDDSPAASRAMRLQMLIEQKAQSSTNLQATSDYLSAADDAAARVADSIIDIRGLALSVNNTTTSDVERTAAVQQIRQTITQLTQIANRDFRGRYLFSGSRAATVPFEGDSRYVAFRGNDRTLPSYVDLGLLVDANLTADEVFGVYSPGVLGEADLNPILTESTKLEDLNGGRGVSKGSILVSDGTSSSTIDLSSAITIGDVIRLIEDNPPSGRNLVVRLTSNGLWIDLDDDSLGGNLSVRNATGSTTATELGILNTSGTGVDPLVGKDLNPRLRPNTLLKDVLGTRASAVLRSPGAGNDLIVEAKLRGPEYNGFQIRLVDDHLLQAAPGITAGNEFATFSDVAVPARAALTFSGSNNNLLLTAKTAGSEYNGVSIQIVNAGVIGNNAVVNYDAAAKQLTIGVDALNQTQIQTVIDAINAASPFSAAYDASDPSDGGFVGTSNVLATDVGVVSGNTGNSGSEANTIFVHVEAGVSTAQGVRDAIESSPTVSNLVSVRFDSKDSDSFLDDGAGMVDPMASAALAGGNGTEFDQSSGLQIVNGDVTYTIDVSKAVTVEDLLNAINSAGANVVAEINAAGNGLNVRSVLSGANFSIGENGGLTATQLGIRSFRADTLLADLNHGLGVDRATGTDLTIIRNDGTSLDIDLSSASTVQDVLDAINNHPLNGDPATRVEARLATVGNGITLVDATNEGAGPLTVVRGQSAAAWDLGLVPRGSSQATAPTPAPGEPETLSGTDVNPQEVKGIFNTLVKLADALEQFDQREIERTMAMLEDDLTRLTYARGEMGARGRFLDTVKTRVDDEVVQLKEALSNDIDADMVDTISELTLKQTALQASLQLIGRTFQLSLLDFL